MVTAPSARYRRHVAELVPTPTVYFVQAEALGLIKIGCTTDLGGRMASLQVGSPDRLSLVGAFDDADAFFIEKDLHRRFQADRTHGEWFRPSEALLAEIALHPIAARKRAGQAALREALRRTYHPAD